MLAASEAGDIRVPASKWAPTRPMILEGCIASSCQTLAPSLDFDELGMPLELVTC